MKKESLKMLQVDEETHLQAKKNAIMLGMSLKSYIKMLVKKDTK